MAIEAAFITSIIDGLVAQVEYNDVNLRMTRVYWSVPSGRIWVRIWNNGVLAVERTINGPASGEENIPGNYRMVRVIDDDGEEVLKLPPQLSYAIEAVS